jgi:hypothetical protein
MPHGSSWRQACEPAAASSTITYTPNPGAQRAGTITIAGLTFTVTQPKAP